MLHIMKRCEKIVKRRFGIADIRHANQSLVLAEDVWGAPHSPPHENSGYLHALDPPQAHEEASNIWQLGSKIDNFTKTVYSVHTPLVFMIFVTNKRFSGWTTLDGFRKERISKSDAIIFSEVCNKQGIFKVRAIKWLLQIINFSDLCH